MIDPQTKTDLSTIQAESGLNRGEFAEAMGYTYDVFKSFYSGRLAIGPQLRRLLVMYQMLSKKNAKIVRDMS